MNKKAAIQAIGALLTGFSPQEKHSIIESLGTPCKPLKKRLTVNAARKHLKSYLN